MIVFYCPVRIHFPKVFDAVLETFIACVCSTYIYRNIFGTFDSYEPIQNVFESQLADFFVLALRRSKHVILGDLIISKHCFC